MKVSKTRQIVLNEDQFITLKKISKTALPNESAALIFGEIKTAKNELVYIGQKIEAVDSTTPSPVAFLIGDLEHLYSLWSKAQDQGYRLLSIFHSHPSGAWPSGTDKRYMKNIDLVYPGIIWIIYGNGDDEFKAFIYQNQKFHRVNLKTKS